LRDGKRSGLQKYKIKTFGKKKKTEQTHKQNKHHRTEGKKTKKQKQGTYLLKAIRLSEISQTQKDKGHAFSPIRGRRSKR
jgi:hypothetical protein